MASGNEFLRFCLAARASGVAASRELEIKDKWVALDLNTAAEYVLRRYDQKQKLDEVKALSRMIAYQVSKIFGDGSNDDADDEDGSVEVW